MSGQASAPSAQAVATTLAPPPTNPLQVSRAGGGSGSVSSSPAGITCGATCSAAFAVGAQVVLTAVPHNSSTFTGWSGGGCSGVGTCTVTMSSAQAVTATFVANSGPTSVKGTISTDTTWTALHSPYLLTGGLTVQTGATLTIDPGVVVIAQAHYVLQVNGRLLADGSQAQPISFTCRHTRPAAGPASRSAHRRRTRCSTTSSSHTRRPACPRRRGRTWTLSNSYVHDNTTGASVSGSAICCAGTLTGNLITHNPTGVSVYYALTEFDDNTITANGTGHGAARPGRRDPRQQHPVEHHLERLHLQPPWLHHGRCRIELVGHDQPGLDRRSHLRPDRQPGLPQITTTPIDSSAVATAPQLLTITPAGSGTGTVYQRPRRHLLRDAVLGRCSERARR